MVWEPADGVAGHKFLYRLDYAFAGVGYKLAGRSTYTNVAGSNKGSYNMTFEKGYVDYVLTRHKKSTYSDEHYVQRNSAIVKVTPLDEPDRVAYAPQNNLQFHTIDKGH